VSKKNRIRSRPREHKRKNPAAKFPPKNQRPLNLTGTDLTCLTGSVVDMVLGTMFVDMLKRTGLRDSLLRMIAKGVDPINETPQPPEDGETVQ
jgi:hypothetical protein